MIEAEDFEKAYFEDVVLGTVINNFFKNAQNNQGEAVISDAGSSGVAQKNFKKKGQKKKEKKEKLDADNESISVELLNILHDIENEETTETLPTSWFPSKPTDNDIHTEKRNKRLERNQERGKTKFPLQVDVFERPDQDYEMHAENVCNSDEESEMLSDEDIDRLIKEFSDDTCEDSSEDEGDYTMKKIIPIVRGEMKPSAPRKMPSLDAAKKKKKTTLEKFDKSCESVIQQQKKLFKEISDLRKSRKRNILEDEIEKMHIDNLMAELQELENQVKTLRMLRQSFESCSSRIMKRLQEALDADEVEQAWQSNLNLKLEFKFLDNRFPIYHKRDEVMERISANQALVVLAETGSGKSTQLTQFLMQAGYGNEKLIACTEPRKVAATSLASHISSEIGSNVGEQVGFHVGYQKRYRNRTKVVYTTNYTLLREVVKDPELKAYSVVIVDEAHERSIGTDLLLGMLKQCLEKRPDLKIIITSATIDPKVFTDYFGGESKCPVVKAGGRTYPVDIIWGDIDKIPDPTSNYAGEAVDLAFSLHRKKPSGDILVFLTAPYEIEDAALILQEKDKKGELEINQLHGKLQSEEQTKVFEQTPKGKRKIVLSTIVGETSITIPGVKYVIDCGLIKENIFDAKRNINKVEVHTVSQSSADQRKGRAGRVSPGECYRLYGKDAYDNMRPGSLPEILRVHLGHALLRLLELGVKNPLEFDFVETPEKDALEAAMANLLRLGAVVKDDDEYQLTFLGGHLAKLPVEPALGKLVLLSIDEGFGYDGILLAAVRTNQGSVFYRAGTDEEKAKSDMTRVNFCLPEGDIITAMMVYKAWLKIGKKQQHKWCIDNNIHTKAVKTTTSTIKDISSILRKEIKVDFEEEYLTLSPSELCRRFQPLLLQCFPENLSVFTGHHRLGYMLAESPGQFAGLHASSALRYLGNLTPKFLLHSQIMTTWRDCLVDVTPIEEEVVEKARENGILKYNPDDMLTVVECDRLGPYGDQIIRKCLNGYIVRREEDAIKKDLGCNFVVIDRDLDTGHVFFFLPENFHEEADVFVQKIRLRLEKEKMEMRNKVAYRPLESVDGVVVTRAAITAGMEVFEILNQGEYIEVLASYTRGFSDLEIESEFRSYGELLKTYFYKGGKQMGNAAVFRNSEDARQCVRSINQRRDQPNRRNGAIGRAMPLFKTADNVQKEGESSQCSISIDFHGSVDEFEPQPVIRRRIHKGFGFISCHSQDDVNSVIRAFKTNKKQLSKLKLKDKPLLFSKSRKNQTDVFIGNIHANVSEGEAQAAVTAILSKVNVSIQKMFLVHERNQFHEAPEETPNSDNPEKKLSDMLENAGVFGAIISLAEGSVKATSAQTNNETLSANDGMEDDNDEWHLQVTFESFESGVAALKSLKKNHDRLSGVTYEIKVVSSMFCSKSIFKNISSPLRSLKEHLKEAAANHGQSSIVTKEGDNRVEIQITTESVELNSTIRYLVDQDFMKGQTEHFSDREVGHCLFTKTGLAFLKTLSEKTKTTIRPENISLSITLYGSEENRCKAMLEIDSYLKKLEENGEIMLHETDIKRPGLLKKLVTKYGIDLQKLLDETHATKMYANVRTQKLVAYCTKEQFEQVCHLVDEVSKTLPVNQAAENEERQTDRTCPVCLCEIEGMGYRLQYCMHVYCHLCIKTQVHNDPTIPLSCCYEGCNEPIVFDDIVRLIPPDSPLAEKIVKESVKSLMGKRTDKYFPCPSPDCKMIFKKGEDGGKAACPYCSNNVCLSCMVVYHEGVTCNEYAITSNDDLREWLRADPEKRKKCGNCSALVEKIDGCNRMQCTRCHSIFCWLCLQVFPNDTQVYNHLGTCRMNLHLVQE